VYKFFLDSRIPKTAAPVGVALNTLINLDPGSGNSQDLPVTEKFMNISGKGVSSGE